MFVEWGFLQTAAFEAGVLRLFQLGILDAVPWASGRVSSTGVMDTSLGVQGGSGLPLRGETSSATNKAASGLCIW